MSTDQIAAFVDHGVETGCVEISELNELVDQLHLGDEEVANLYERLEEHHVEVNDDCGREKAESTYINGDLAHATTDALQLFLNEMARYPLLTAEEEVELAKRIERGDKAAKDRMINSNLRLVVSIAKRYQRQGIALGDLIQDGIIGLNRAVEKFDWRKGYKFSTYATWWIRQACQRAVANQSRTIRVPTHVHERRVKLNRTRRKFELEEGREPTAEELATATGIELQHVEEALGVAEVSASLNQAVGSEGDGELGDLFADPSASDPAEEAGDALRRQEVRAAVKALPERERRILELRFGFDGQQQPLEAIGRELGITRERVRQLERDALARLARKLGDDEELADAA